MEVTKEVSQLASLCGFVLAGEVKEKREEMQTRYVAISQSRNKKKVGRRKGDYKLEKKETKINPKRCENWMEKRKDGTKKSNVSRKNGVPMRTI